MLWLQRHTAVCLYRSSPPLPSPACVPLRLSYPIPASLQPPTALRATGSRLEAVCCCEFSSRYSAPLLPSKCLAWRHSRNVGWAKWTWCFWWDFSEPLICQHTLTAQNGTFYAASPKLLWASKPSWLVYQFTWLGAQKNLPSQLKASLCSRHACALREKATRGKQKTCPPPKKKSSNPRAEWWVGF